MVRRELSRKKIVIVIVLSGLIFLFLGLQIFTPWVFFEGKACEHFGGCQVPLANNKQYNYWLVKAVEREEPELCDEVNGLYWHGYYLGKESAAFLCKARYAGLTGQVDYCAELENLTDIGIDDVPFFSICLFYLALDAGNLETCMKLPNNPVPFSLRDYCIENIAAKRKDISMCLGMPEGTGNHKRGSLYSCLVHIGITVSNPEVCFNLPNTEDVYNCVIEIALILRKPEYCEFINEEHFKNKCRACFR